MTVSFLSPSDSWTEPATLDFTMTNFIFVVGVSSPSSFLLECTTLILPELLRRNAAEFSSFVRPVSGSETRLGVFCFKNVELNEPKTPVVRYYNYSIVTTRPALFFVYGFIIDFDL